MSLPNKNSYNSLGGELQDYSPITDPTTDLSAEADNETRADTAAMTRTAIRAWAKFYINVGTAIIVPNKYDAVYGNAVLYKPTATYNDVGNYTITFPEEVTDARGNVQTINLQVAWATVEESDTGGPTLVANAKVIAANMVQVYLNAGTTDPPDETYAITVFTL